MFEPKSQLGSAEVRDLPFLPELFAIRKVQRETADTFTVSLDSVGQQRGMAFRPGQFNMVYVFGTGEIPLSISGDPSDSGVLIHTTRAVGTVTRAFERLKRGDQLGIRGPYGAPWPLEEAETKDVVIVAGGIGLAPLRPALYSILHHRDLYGNVVLLYGTRTPADILFREELEQWRARFDLEVHVTVDRATSGWKGNVGVVPTLIAKSSFDPRNVVTMICGPEVMMRFTAMEFMKRGVSGEHIYLSMERNMECGVGLCGHCQFGPHFVCKDGPVFRYDRIKELLMTWEI